jgi:hypothetical protein
LRHPPGLSNRLGPNHQLRPHRAPKGDLTKLVAAQSEKLVLQDHKLDEILRALTRKASMTTL